MSLTLPLAVPHTSIPLTGTGGVVTGIPDLNQLNEPTQDQAADENSRDNCVFTCNADLSRFYRPDLDADGDAIKDSVPAYGQGYVGFSSQDTIIASGVLERRWGIHSWRIAAPTRQALLQQLIALANGGTPAIVTIPSLWGSQPQQAGYNPDAPNFYTHACVFAGTLPDGTCVLVNPWGGFLMYYSQPDLALRLCYLCAYPVVKAAEVTQAMAWTKQADGTGRDGAGHACGTGFMAELIAKGETGVDGRLGETYVAGAQGFKSFLPLTNGDVLVWTGSQVAHDGALVAAELFRLLVAAQHQPPQTVTVQVPAPADPVKDKALAALQDLKAALAEL